MAPVIRFRWNDGADTDIALPAYQTEGAAGADIRANFAPANRADGLTLLPMQRALCPTGLSVEIPPGFEMQIRPRSGLALEQGVTLANSPGTIDSDYRGPLGVILINLSQDDVTITHGQRIAQILIAPVVVGEFVLSDTLGQTERGSGGFGSTGAD